MITVKYQIRMDEKDQVIDAFERKFKDAEAREKYERSQMKHPFLTLKVMKVIEEDNAKP